MFKAAFGGGGRGMRVVKKMDEVAEQFERARQVFNSKEKIGETSYIKTFITDLRQKKPLEMVLFS